ncbi:MAG: hypothetical protein ABSH30_12870, partial [Acidimicrobiales bacterium]
MAAEAPQRDDAVGRTARLARSVLHLTAVVAPAVPIGTTVGLQISRGWRPTSDDAAIAWRTWDVFSAHAPLVGAFNDATLSNGHAVFDPGPLEYYLLAVPERIDPVHGILWGAAVLCAVLAGLAVEAAWRASGVLAAVPVAAGFLVLAATQPTSMIDLPWNPNLGVFAFSATLVLSAVAGSGRLRWWPVAVVAGSLAVQCHLVFGIAACVCLLAGLLLGARQQLTAPALTQLSESRSSPPGAASEAVSSGAWRGIVRPACLGVVLGLVSLAAPFAQQVEDSPGNLTLLLRNLANPGPRLGDAFGLRGIGRIAGFPPAWARPAPPISGADWYQHFRQALVAGGAVAARRPGLAALASAGVVSGLAMAWTFGSIANPFATVVTYTDVALWPVGMALDACLLWAAWELAAAGYRYLTATTALPLRLAGWDRTQAGALLAAAVLTPLLVWSVTTLVPAASTNLAVIGGWQVARAVTPLAEAIEKSRPSEPVLVEPSVQLLPSGLPTWALTEGLAYELHVAGIDVRLMPPMQPELGPDAAPAAHQIVYLVEPRGSGWTLVR